MAECKNCFHEKVCKYVDEKVSSGTTVKELIHECVDFAPAADVAEVKHGEWKRVECGTICTQCRRVYDNDFEFSHEKVKQYFKYCPECGADMRERGNN